jgi:hypothetical protein
MDRDRGSQAVALTGAPVEHVPVQHTLDLGLPSTRGVAPVA